jgi:hypothetical protein
MLLNLLCCGLSSMQSGREIYPLSPHVSGGPVIKNKDLFKMNSDVNTFNTRSNCDLHFPVINLTMPKRGKVLWY